MKYVAGIFILWSVIYILSYAKYNLNKKNKLAAAGSIVLGILIVSLPIIYIFIK